MHGPETRGAKRYKEALHMLGRWKVYFCYLLIHWARLTWACLLSSEQRCAQPAALPCKLQLEDLQQH